MSEKALFEWTEFSLCDDPNSWRRLMKLLIFILTSLFRLQLSKWWIICKDFLHNVVISLSTGTVNSNKGISQHKLLVCFNLKINLGETKINLVKVNFLTYYRANNLIVISRFSCSFTLNCIRFCYFWHLFGLSCSPEYFIVFWLYI